MQKNDNKIKLTLKYDDGKEKYTLEVDKTEMDSFLEKEYLYRLANTPLEKRNTVRKLTAEECIEMLNRESYNNWHKYNRHTSGCVKNDVEHDGEEAFVNPIYLIPDKSAKAYFDEIESMDYIRDKLYSHLPQKQADLLWMVFVDHIPITTIAQNEGVTTRAVYLRLETAKKNFKKFFPNPSIF